MIFDLGNDLPHDVVLLLTTVRPEVGLQGDEVEEMSGESERENICFCRVKAPTLNDLTTPRPKPYV